MHYKPVLILRGTVVAVKMQVGLSLVVCLQEMMKHASDVIGTLSSIDCFINEVVYLE